MCNKPVEEKPPETTMKLAVCYNLQKMLSDFGLESIEDLKPTKVESEETLFYWEKMCYELDDTPFCPLLSIGKKEFIKCQRAFCGFYVGDINRCSGLQV